MSTVGSICANRSITLAAPKSGEHEDQTAPILAAASSAMIACGPFGSSRRHPVPGAHAEVAQAPRHPGHLAGELAVGESSAASPFGSVNQRDAAGIGPCGPQRIAGVVDHSPLNHRTSGMGPPASTGPGPRSPSTPK